MIAKAAREPAAQVLPKPSMSLFAAIAQERICAIRVLIGRLLRFLS
jgi:hypothetical protein